MKPLNGSVIAFTSGNNELGYVKTTQWYSSTTTRHVNKYLDNLNHSEVNQDTINNLVKEQIPARY